MAAKKGSASTTRKGDTNSPRRGIRPAASKSATKTATTNLQGWASNPGGKILVEEKIAKTKPIPASKLRDGIVAAQGEIKQSLQEIASLMTMDFEVSEIELSMSFSAKGEFLGFGVGGAASIKIKIKPVSID